MHRIGQVGDGLNGRGRGQLDQQDLFMAGGDQGGAHQPGGLALAQAQQDARRLAALADAVDHPLEDARAPRPSGCPGSGSSAAPLTWCTGHPEGLGGGRIQIEDRESGRLEQQDRVAG